MAEATSKRAAAMSVPFRNRIVTRPLPFIEWEDTLSLPETVDNAPSIREVTPCSSRRAEAPGHEKNTSILRSVTVGAYWMLSIGSMATPTTVSAAIISSTEKAGIPRREADMFRGVFIGGAYKSRNRPEE